MNNFIITLFVCLFGTVLIAQVSPFEKEALLDLYSSTNGDAWNTSWDLKTPVKDWSGVTVEDNKVIGIKMFFNNLEGELPATLGNLEYLQTLELSFNKLSGTIPSEFGNLKELKTLAFNGNNLTGEIPSTIGKLTNLTQLHLSSNKLSGNLPESIADLEILEVLNVFDNNLSGKLSSKLAYSESLKQLIVAENNFEQSNEFSAIILSSSASVKLKETNIVQESNQIIANETEDEN